MQGWYVLERGKARGRGAQCVFQCGPGRGKGTLLAARRPTRHGKSNLGSTSQIGSIKGQSRRHMPGASELVVLVKMISSR